MGKINVRAKGAGGELEVAKLLQTVVNRVAIQCGFVAPTMRRNVEQSQVGGEDLIGLPWYSIEVKRVERVDLNKWWAQTLTQAARKAPGATSWDALAKGGWKRIASASTGLGFTASSGLVPGTGSGAGLEQALAGLGGSLGVGPRLAVLPTSSDLVATGAGSKNLKIRGNPLILANPLNGENPTNNPKDFLSLPAWANGLSSLGNGACVDKIVDNPDGLGKGKDGLGNLVATNGPALALIAGKPPPVARDPVLIWRQNNQPWSVRFVGNIVCTNGFKLASVVDTSLDSWLEILREDLGTKLRG